ncbi:T9SS type A sorting domain-containing protein [Flammeovirga sp. EKP202]|uniref:T9SS type A sorting domain-containing protein n=1 Tax=Flammeovirga sp. EKP202 TaxID=2770592 RepID=UPI00165EFEA8|nr:T9SS type A sorting domain-containing protein [Flammeovirga sp. EKP202]MBD0401341.1 T9SS type A sorting domain-containing protein [Flammeovirga sp. EKP202]
MRCFNLFLLPLMFLVSCVNLEEVPVGVKPNFGTTEIDIKNDTTITSANLFWSTITIHEDVRVDVVTAQLTSSKFLMKEGSSIMIHGSAHITDVDFIAEGKNAICGKEGVRLDVDGVQYIMPEGGSCFDTGDDLPVELLYFKTTLKDNEVLIEWSTATEINNEKFIVERSVDKKNWVGIATIEGAGNSSVPLKYDHLDQQVPNASIIYYRLKQMDFDGATTIYGPSAISNADVVPELTVYPNPIRYGEKLNVLSNTNGFDVNLFDSTGRLYGQFSTDNNYLEIPMIYGVGLLLVEVKTFSGNTRTEKVIVN